MGRFPLGQGPGVSLPREALEFFRREPTLDVQLADGTAAIAVTRHCDVRTVLTDNRFSRAQFHMRTLWARSDAPIALATTDPPVHTARRRAIQGWFTTRKAEQALPFIEQLADRLIGELLATGPPADVYARFCHPFPNLVHMNLLGLDIADLQYLAPRMTAVWSSGHCRDDEIDKSAHDLQDYFASQVSRSRRGDGLGGLIDALVHDRSANGLTDPEISMLAMGLLVSGAETTGCQLALGLIEILQRPGLADALRTHPDQIPSLVEELLRWVWFLGFGRAHVAIAEVQLHDRLIAKGDVVVPIPDVANRDPGVFPDADDFCPQRSPNPHLGFGHGPHKCVGMAFARMELQVGLRVMLSRLTDLALVEDSEVDWRTDMFTRGVWTLPMTWRGEGQ